MKEEKNRNICTIFKNFKLFFGVVLLSLLAILASCRTTKNQTKPVCYGAPASDAILTKDTVSSNPSQVKPNCYGAPANPNLK